MVKYKISSWDAPPGFVWPRAIAINDTGQICGFAFPEDWLGGARPVVWLGGAGQTLAVPGDEGAAYDINEAGDVVGYLGSYEPDHSAFLHRNGTTSMLTGLPGPWSIARSINNNGLIAGTCGPMLGSRVFVYDSNQDALVETIEPLPGHAATSGGYINDDSHVVGISSNESGQDSRLFIRRNGSTDELGTATLVAGINQSGMVVGTRGPVGGIRYGGAFRYVPSGLNPGFQQCGSGADAYGINEAGLVVGWYWVPVKGGGPGDDSIAPFVHYPTDHPDAGFQDLNAVITNLAGWYSLPEGYDINKHGSIAGRGIRTGGSVAVFVLEPQPTEPNFMDRHLLQYLALFGGVSVGGGGWGLPPGGPPVPIPPHGLRELLPAQRDLAVGWLANHLAAVVSNERLGAEMHKVARELIVAAAKELEKR